MTKDTMLDNVITKFGFESEITIQFADALEWLGLNESRALYAEVMQMDGISLEEE